jgi:16S rRNA (guanine527-N7)-methyltransferase
MVRDESTPGAAPRRGRYADHRRRAIPIEREPLPTRVMDTPALPTAYDDALDAGLDALRLELTGAARAAIDGHVRLLLFWTEAINLTAIRDPATVAVGHVVDSLSAVDVLLERGVDRILDLGSGGGFPGLPLAAAIPGASMRLVEPIGKKARFLDVAVRAVDLAERVRITDGRAEALAADPSEREAWPAITARAVASTAELVELAFPLLEPGGVLVAWKRGDVDAELDAAARAMDALGGGRLAVRPVVVPGLAGHKLLVATRGRAPVPAAYPRDPAARRRRPW